MNQLGIILRTLRLKHGELLYDMAQNLGVSPAFLSSVENGKRSAPASWLHVLSEKYDLLPEQQAELTTAIGETVKQIRLDVSNASPERRNCALTFARRFDDFSDEEVQQILSVLEKGGN